VSGRVEHDGRSYDEVATPVQGYDGYTLLLSAPLDDALAGVRLIGRSLLVAGLVALIASAIAAYWAAYGLTRRLRRLETAASQIAAGDFSRPIEAKGEDEVAELAREFDTMRVRLADLDRARREFIANASHELRTPLFSLGGFLELLADEDLDEETRREFLEETREQVSRLTRLATDLLDLSRLDAGRLHVETGEVDLAEAARMLADEFRLLAEAGERPL
jgi:signal transduction histidine kinase